MPWIVPALPYIFTAAGAGVAAYGQYQSGKSAESIANYNAQNQRDQAEMSMLQMQAQSEQIKASAEANLALRTQEANARFQNATMLEDKAKSDDSVSRLNIRKKAEEYARMQGEQRAAIAGSGIVEASGSPLDLLAETAAKIQADQDVDHYANEVARRQTFREADLERLGGNMALAGATLDRNNALAEANLTESAGRISLLSGRREAEITRLTGSAARTEANYNAIGSLISGTGSLTKGVTKAYSGWKASKS
jgi:hypothetical protein